MKSETLNLEQQDFSLERLKQFKYHTSVEEKCQI